MNKFFTVKTFVRLLILLGLAVLSYVLGHYISVATNSRLYLNSHSSRLIASWDVDAWATFKAVSYGATGAVISVLSGICLMLCSIVSDKYNDRNKRFARFVAVAVVLHVVTVVAGALLVDQVINIFDNSLLHWHILHLIPLSIFQVIVLCVCLIFPSRHVVRF